MRLFLPLALLGVVLTTQPLAAAVSLPIEIMGTNGTVREVTVSIPNGSTANRLWLQTHALTYQGKASVRVNGGTWIALRNDNAAVKVADPGKAHGGIGGGFMALKLSVDLPSGALVNGNNTIAFRFNQTDGRASGWRVLALNALNAAGTQLIPANAFVQDDPATWTPPRSGSADIAAGANLWNNASLVDKPGGPAILARCSSCHAHDGRDLKYFAFSNHSIIERSKFHGLNQTQAEQIASYIRTLPVTAYGRPWNPPYQPGPGLDAKPVEAWSAGAGLEWVFDHDAQVANYLPGNGTDRAAHLVEETRRFKTYNRREIPLAFQFLDWNHWLPEIHPMDALGKGTFEAHASWTMYLNIRRGLDGLRGKTKQQYILDDLRRELDTWKDHINGDDARITSLSAALGRASTLENYRRTYAGNLWTGIKLWEIMQEYRLEELSEQFYGVNGEKRQWFSNRHVFNFAPHIISNDHTRDKLVVGDHSPMLMFNYLSNSWYEMQLILHAGSRNATKGGHHNNDWKYHWFFTGATTPSIEAMQGLAMGWKSLQEIDHGWGPDGRDRGDRDNTWWGYSLRDGRPNLGRILNHDDWPGFTRAQAAPYLKTLYTAFLEKVATFSLAQWAKTDAFEFHRKANYVWGSFAPEESIPDLMRVELHRLANIYGVDDAVVNAYADWGRFKWPNNNWAQYRRGAAAIAAPGSITATAGIERVTVTWAPVAGATSYNVKRADSANGVYLPARLFTTGTSYIDPLLAPGKTWYYKVSANLGRGEGPDSASASATTTFGLVARWTFDESSGNQAADSGPFALHGKVIGTPSRTSGQLSNAVALSGTTFTSVPTNLGRWLSGTFTMTAWIRTTATGDNTLQNAPMLAGCTQNDIHDSDRILILGALDATGRIGVRCHINGPDVKSANPINNGAWHHVAITRDAASGSVQIFVNAGTPNSGTPQSGYLYKRTSSIGRPDEARMSNYWQGGVDDVRIYNRVLSAAEVQTIFADRSTGGGTGPGNILPTVAITAPTNGTSFDDPSSLTIQATASDSDGTVAKVEFFAGATKIGEDSTSPYSVTWSNPSTGTHALTARATDNQGATTVSGAVTVTITAPVPHVGTGTGWLGRYFANKTLLAPAMFERRDAAIDFLWGTGSPDARLPVDAFSVRWTGTLLAQYSETYTFTTTTDDGVRLWVNNQLIVDSWIDQGPTPRIGTIALTAGQSYPVIMEYYENAGGAEAKLTWSSTSTPTAIVPGTQITAPEPGAVNSAPTVALTAPANGSSVALPTTVTITATASDSDGTVAKVEFFFGATKIGADTTSPYSFAWVNPPVGTHSLTARATDNLGATTVSTARSLTVNAPPNTPPTVALTAPENDSTATNPTTVTITATASDSDGTVAKVEFFTGATKIGEDTTSPYSFAWVNPPVGTQSLTARATDNLGATTVSAARSITVTSPPNTPPAVALTAPTNGSSVTNPTTVTITATASDSDGTVAKVEFFVGATKIGEDTTSPYSFAWVNPPVGTQSLTARATDDLGGSTTSSARTITVTAPPNVPPTVAITAPASGSSATNPTTVTITATASDSDGTVAKVEFFAGATKLGEDTTNPYSFAWVNPPVGTHALTARASDNLGATTVSAGVQLTVVEAAAPPIGPGEGNDGQEDDESESCGFGTGGIAFLILVGLLAFRPTSALMPE